MAHAKHGEIINGWLHKRGRSVVKFWMYGGYALPIEELLTVKGVKLYTQYDGKLQAERGIFNKHGIPHLFKDGRGKLEHQLILPLQYWEEF
jgi:hypothetical protein